MTGLVVGLVVAGTLAATAAAPVLRRRRRRHRRRAHRARQSAAQRAPVQAAPAGEPIPVALRAARGTFPLDIVGEADHTRTLRRLYETPRKPGEEPVVTATLVCVRDDSFDTRAVRVDVGHQTVGRLSPAHARAYRARLTELGEGTAPRTCDARIRDDWARGTAGDQARGRYGVRLALQLRAT